jgi:peptidoglycan-associated lipoprotein
VYLRSLAVLWAVAFLAFSLSACGGSSQTVKPTSTSDSTVAAKKDTTAAATDAQNRDKNAANKGNAAGASVRAVELKDVRFDFDKYVIGSEGADILKQNAQWFKANSGRLRVEGNCDERGSVEYNLALGQKRAEAAKNLLTTLGIDGARIETVSYGKEKPADPGHSEAAWAKNRRDTFVPVK